MKSTKLRKIGGSKGVILSKSILEEIDLGNAQEFEVKVINGTIVLSPFANPLDEFARFFENNPNFGAESMILEDSENEIDKEKYTW